MDHRTIAPRASAAAVELDHSEDMIADVDEPPDTQRIRPSWTPPKTHTSFSKADPQMYNRRESLLTRQLHSETDHTDEEERHRQRPPPRTLSTQSTWSNPSVASTAELTSDDGHSLASPAISPPLPPTAIRAAVPNFVNEKPLSREPTILSTSHKTEEPTTEKSVEEGLGRKRCISFACGNKDNKAQAPVKKPEVQPETAAAASPPKRKCMLKFVCPTRTTSETKHERPSTASKRAVSPPPPEKKPNVKPELPKAHRGSDSTVTHASPRTSRKYPAAFANDSTPGTPRPSYQRKLSNDSDRSTEATRFHEFASSDDEPEEWVQESTCHRSRLTVDDTLKKETVIRKACEEVEEEVVEEEDDEDDLEDDAELDEDDDDEDDLEEESDEGFKTDDEEGFAESDSEDDDSDEEWWRPGGLSTAATSMEHMDRLAHNSADASSSVGSASSSHIQPRTIRPKSERKPRPNNMPIRNQREGMDLPDSTDFVCGTLDEDRPLEQAYLNHKKQREAARHKARPQDIDPTFPTSDPDMDEEDDDDLEDPEDSEEENLMHGDIEELDGDSTLRRRPSQRSRTRSTVHKSPPPPARHRSPAPGAKKTQRSARSPPPPARHRSPAPGALKRQTTARSPPPPARARSPQPPLKRTSTAISTARQRSPAPAGMKKPATAHSPPPRKLFGHSPPRNRSPAGPGMRTTSPPNTRRASPNFSSTGLGMPHVLASRPQLTYTASLPRGGGYTLGKPHTLRPTDDDCDDSDTVCTVKEGDLPKRGAIDIFKGLERKRQRRKEKLYQKACAKAAAKGEKAYKVKPGKGAERMREVGLEMQRYRGKGEHILSL
ncbi:uncharacterized protein MYCGRDRAFT_117725 [Zymoseptoria tritici IPO323]|uniref:Extensin domain-containing protein n=1 Tax=Zymoseptoria tritici (strain CBS 115943 / IPO323) TaxID=336722 RepID=F9WZZ9_ZYMTI|nr:uncharacterized protein MYCGRDRAFT_117725 [Zymoseptoria tritici IPO323]EGP92459.1 hypothetical protein MYCGRDRAFT_117725 [Zymoseptoria tritici IPO323]